jgi:hypothetical protein
MEAADFVAVGGSSNREHGEPPVDAHPVILLAVGASGMASFAVEVRSGDIEAHMPTASMPADRGEQDPGQWRDNTLARLRADVFGGSQQPSQPAGVVMHPDRPEGG